MRRGEERREEAKRGDGRRWEVRGGIDGRVRWGQGEGKMRGLGWNWQGETKAVRASRLSNPTNEWEANKTRNMAV